MAVSRRPIIGMRHWRGSVCSNEEYHWGNAETHMSNEGTELEKILKKEKGNKQIVGMLLANKGCHNSDWSRTGNISIRHELLQGCGWVYQHS